MNKPVPPSEAETFFRYTPVSDAERRWGLFPTTAGMSCCPPGAFYPPARHPQAYHFSWNKGRTLWDFQLIYITRGEGTLETSRTPPQRIVAGTVFMLFPGVWHRYAPNSAIGWDEHWLGFDGDYPRDLLAKQVIAPEQPVFDIGMDDVTLAAFARALDLVKREPLGFRQSLSALALEILGRIHLARALRETRQDGALALVKQVKLYLAEHLKEPVDLDALAHRLGVSYSALRQAFKAHTGFSPHQYQLELRLVEAKALLASTDLPVKQVSHSLGFQTPFYFSRFFKQRTGASPEQWRVGDKRGQEPSSPPPSGEQ